MKRKTRFRPFLELLEDRCVPATVRFAGNLLFISNPTVVGGVSHIIVNEVGPNQFQVLDNGASVGTYTTSGSILIKGGNANESDTVNVNGQTMAGNLFVLEGNGNNNVNVVGSGGAILGNVTVLGGLGNDSVSVNYASAGSVTIGGTITVASVGSGTDTVRLGNPSAPSQFLGNVNVSGFSTVRVGPADGAGVTQPDVFGGDINASVGPNQTIDFQQDPAGAGTATITIGGSLRVSGGSGDVGVLTGTMNINKDLVVNLLTSDGSRTGNNDLSVTGQASGVTQVAGNLIYNGGGNNVLDLAGGVFQGNVLINLANGNDSIALDNAAPTSINGNLNVTKGNGSLNTEPYAPIAAAINGSVNFNVGNASSTIAFDPTGGGVVQGKINIHAGNGADSILFQGPQLFNVNILLGSSDDTVTLNGASASITGSANGGAGTNVFQQLGGSTIVPPFQLINF